MINKKESLMEAPKLVLEHKEQMDRELWEGIHCNVPGMQRGYASKENLRKWFTMAVGPVRRDGAAPALDRRKEMIEAFDKWYENVMNKILPECNFCWIREVCRVKSPIL